MSKAGVGNWPVAPVATGSTLPLVMRTWADSPRLTTINQRSGLRIPFQKRDGCKWCQTAKQKSLFTHLESSAMLG